MTSNESLAWLQLQHGLPVWSRLYRRNTAGRYRKLSKLQEYDVEIEQRLWSLWGNLHPEAAVFGKALRGRQYLACCVMACCAASVYELLSWNAQLLDTIVVSGNSYFANSIKRIKQQNYEFSLENLNINCALGSLKFVVHIEHVCYGKLYRLPSCNRMNLAQALDYFFSRYQYGIVTVRNRALAIGYSLGHNGGYFMFDCQQKEHPLFPKQQAAAYVLRTRQLQLLLHCIVVTLDVLRNNTEFSIHKVELLRKGAAAQHD